MPNVQEKQLRWYNIALMSLLPFGDSAMLSITMLTGVSGCLLWVFIFALYFIPYALIVGQLGSTFKEGKGASVPD